MLMQNRHPALPEQEQQIAKNRSLPLPQLHIMLKITLRR